MNLPGSALLRAWGTYYAIVGSSAGALTGLQFVVLSLVAQTTAVDGSREATSAFGTPTVVHFCGALLVAAILSAPWGSLQGAGALVAICGAAGLAYGAVVLRRASRQRSYQPVLEDWAWHIVLPFLAYGSLLAGGFLLGRAPAGMLFVIGGALLLLVFIGIHNAWDTVMYIAVDLPASRRQRDERISDSRTRPAPDELPAPPPSAPSREARGRPSASPGD